VGRVADQGVLAHVHDEVRRLQRNLPDADRAAVEFDNSQFALSG
jgi:hypothetical protein